MRLQREVVLSPEKPGEKEIARECGMAFTQGLSAGVFLGVVLIGGLLRLAGVL